MKNNKTTIWTPAIIFGDDKEPTYYRCSNCNTMIKYGNKKKYCSECGAKTLNNGG